MLPEHAQVAENELRAGFSHPSEKLTPWKRSAHKICHAFGAYFPRWIGHAMTHLITATCHPAPYESRRGLGEREQSSRLLAEDHARAV